MESTYIIGEIGQNHNGSVDIYNKLTEKVSPPNKEDDFGIDIQPIKADKLNKRYLSE